MIPPTTLSLTDDEIRLTKWFDGELDDDEVADLLARDHGFFDERGEVREIGEFVRLRGRLPGDPEESVEPPFPELFNRRILRRIEEEPRNAWVETWRLFRSSLDDWMGESQWALPVASAALLVAGLVVVTGWESGRVPHSEIVHTYAPHRQHSVKAEFSKRAEAMVISLEGLEPIPETEVVTGYFRDGSEQGLAVAADFRLGQPAVLSTAERPRMDLVTSVSK